MSDGAEATRPDETTAILRWIMQRAEAAKEPCGTDPESPTALRNGMLASIAQAAAQALGLVRGPSFGSAVPPEQEAPLTEALRELVEAVTVEVNEKGAGGYLLARLTDARAALAASPRPLTEPVIDNDKRRPPLPECAAPLDPDWKAKAYAAEVKALKRLADAAPRPLVSEPPIWKFLDDMEAGVKGLPEWEKQRADGIVFAIRNVRSFLSASLSPAPSITPEQMHAAGGRTPPGAIPGTPQDAARYRWLRDRPSLIGWDWWPIKVPRYANISPEFMDEAIDAAMGAAPEGAPRGER